MSRRKQARPRHVDDPDLESPAIATNSVVPVFQGEGVADDSEKTEPAAADETADDSDSHAEDVKPEGEVAEDQNFHPGVVASHVCIKCQAQFLNSEDLVLHQKDCMKPVMLLFKENQSEKSENQSDLCQMNGLNSQASDNQEESAADDFEEEGINEEPVSNFENLNAEDEVDAGEDQDSFEKQSNFDNMDSDFNKSLEEGEEEEENDYNDMKETELGEKIKSNPTAADLTAYMRQLSSLLPSMGAQASSNVMLEPIEATKAAVAQFAENNPDQEKDVGKLHAALYNLQQQQIMQLQLIHQLQQQLVSGGTPNGHFPAAFMNGQLPLGLNLSLPGMPGSHGNKNVSSKSSSRNDSPSPQSDCPSPSELDKSKPLSSRSSSPSRSEQHSPLQLVSAGPSEIGESPVSLLMTAASKAGSHTTPSSSSPSGLLNFSRSASKGSSEGQSYVAGGDDPFFKHKCRLCGKVFGSDSALQIHVRSHTDMLLHEAFMLDAGPLGMGATMSPTHLWTSEKPFQCNICGGRFSTRGNLKVHFQRHKAEFPSVEMNPNPVPEHMDKNPMPMLGSPFPAAALTPFANPAFMMPGFMNGFMFPPPHLTPRHPFGVPSMMPKPPGMHMDERRPSSPKREERHSEVKKETSPATPSMNSYHRRPSPDRKESQKVPNTVSPSSIHMSRPSPVLPMSSVPLVSTYPVMSPLPSHPPFPPHRAPVVTPSSIANGDPFRNTILPSNILDNDDNLEQFMEIDKSETSKLQQLVDNIEHKLTDPNQCVICHRVLSCKSALQMHYRIHTGERPFKCKICGRSFTTKGNLKTHMGVHRAKPPLRMMHQCPVCHKQFTNLLVLQQHIRSHTGMSGLPTLPGLSHLGMFAARPPMDDRMGYGPLNLKRHYPEDNEKELDLSKKPRQNKDEEHPIRPASLSNGERDLDGDEDDSGSEYQDEMDDEANKIAADEAKKEGLVGENSDDQSTMDDSRDSKLDNDRPTSRTSNIPSFQHRLIPRPSSPKYLQEDSNHGQDSSFNAYSTSLAALEERVRQIDTTMARNPLSQFHAAPFLLAPSYTNGDGGMSPRSDSGSDEGRKVPTPGDGSLGSNYLLGALDGQTLDANSKATTCNVCYKTFACKSALDIHYRSHTRERPYKCDLCDKTFTTRGNMKQHLLTHSLNDGNENGDYESNNNNSCTPNQNNDSDIEDSNDSSKFESQQIEIAKKTEQVESQVKVKKELESSSVVEKSSTSTSSHSSSSSNNASSSLRTSTYSSPPDSQSPFISKTPTVKHQCLVCQKGFSSASALQIHIRTHTGDKPFKCTVCGKAFTTKGNLKVHMGTHMWNNSPSRRGRRMSIEPPFMLAHKENPYVTHGFQPRPEFYPFQFPPFMNGLPTPPKSLSDVALLPGMASRMGLKTDLSSPPSEERRKSETSPVQEEKPKYAESGELDLSMKSMGSSGSRSSEKTSPSSIDSNSSSGMVSPPHMSLGWGWKASCHLCSRSFPTPAALEHHIRSMHMTGMSLPKVEAS